MLTHRNSRQCARGRRFRMNAGTNKGAEGKEKREEERMMIAHTQFYSRVGIESTFPQ